MPDDSWNRILTRSEWSDRRGTARSRVSTHQPLQSRMVAGVSIRYLHPQRLLSHIYKAEAISLPTTAKAPVIRSLCSRPGEPDSLAVKITFEAFMDWLVALEKLATITFGHSWTVFFLITDRLHMSSSNASRLNFACGFLLSFHLLRPWDCRSWDRKISIMLWNGFNLFSIISSLLMFMNIWYQLLIPFVRLMDNCIQLHEEIVFLCLHQAPFVHVLPRS